MNIQLSALMDNSNFISNNKIVNTNEYILDPFSTIVKLAVLSNKPLGTKLNIASNVIYIQEPSILQPIYRYSFSTNKTNLQYLYNPIEFACKIYLTQSYTTRYPTIIELFRCAQNGLSKLSETYKNCSMVRLCLNYYNGIISNYFKNLNEQIFLKELFKKDTISSLYTPEILTEFEEIWTPDKITVILNLTSFLINDDNAYDNVRSIETIIHGIDIQVQELQFS
jgi:hypothetical protein